MSEHNLPTPLKSIIHRSSSDFSGISNFSEKKFISELNERQVPNFSEISNSNTNNNPSYMEYRSNMSKKNIKEGTSVPIEYDTELHIEDKFNNFTTKLSRDFDKLPKNSSNNLSKRESKSSPSKSSPSQLTKTVLEEKSESLESDSEGSSNNNNEEFALPKQSLPSNKLESLLLENITNSKSRKSYVVSFGAGNKGLFSTNEYEETRKTKRDKTIKEEDEFQEINESQKIIGEICLTERNPEQETIKSFQKGSKVSKEEKIATNQRTLYSVISNFYLTKKFILLLRNSTIYRRPKWLKSSHFRMINDWSFWFDGWKLMNNDDQGNNETGDCINSQKKGFFQIINKTKKFTIKYLKKLMELVPETFDPTQKFRVFWDLMHFLIIILNLIITPIEIGFDLKNAIMDNVILQFFVDFSLGFFILDLIVNLNTAFYDKGTLIFSRSMIFRHYISGSMFRDVLSFFSQFLANYYRNSYINYFDLFILLRLYNLKKIFISIEEFITVDEKLYNTLALLKLIFGVFFLSHLLACLWHFVGIIQGENQITWIVYYHLEHTNWYIRYLYSYYFVVISMNTVGYGDLVPQTVYERFFTIFFIYFACWVFAYTINSIGIILQDINRMNHDYNRSNNLINGYMKQKNISFELQMRIRKYIQFIWQEEKTHSNLETSRVIDKLSKSLRQELLLQANGVILRDLPMFNLNFSEETLKKIVYTMKEVSFIPGDPIYFANDIDDKSLYILRSGEVELYLETPRFNDPITIVKTLTKKGEVFGEYSFFSDKERESCARSSTFTSVFIIRQQDLMEIITDNPLDYQSFCQIKDQINLYQKFDGLYLKCPICYENQHLSQDCPLLHLVLSKSRIIQKYNYSEYQKRTSGFPRKKLKILNALKNYEKHENLAQKLHQHLHSEEDDEDTPSEDRVSNDSHNSKISKHSEDTSPQDREDGPKLPETRPILKAMTLHPIFSTNQITQVSNDSKSSLTLPGNNEFLERKLETNMPKFFADVALASPKSKTQIVAFAPSKDFSYESLSVASNFSKRSKLDNNETKNKRKNQRSTTADLSKKISSSLEEDSHNRKSGNTPRKINRENSGTFDSKKSQKSNSSEKNSLNLAGVLKKNDEQKETQIFTTTTENKELQLDDICKSFDNYFIYNNVEKVLEKVNENNERKRKKKKLSKLTSKVFGNFDNSLKTLGATSPHLKNRRRGMNRSNFFQKKDEKGKMEEKKFTDRRKSIFDKAKILEFLKEEERKKVQKMGIWAKMKNLLSAGARDEDLLSKYFIKGSLGKKKIQK